ncbi:MAG TPA: CHAD domain-containing protein [Ornithinibacter sp.]|nr:CHAD domain-containing protein [Ornithinibacter sp.]
MTLTAALGGDAEPRKARPVALTADEPASAAFVTVATECVDHWRTNAALLGATRAMPHLHQTRVGIRRLRSSFSLFRPFLGHVPGSAQVAHRLRALALPFGAARDLDVLLAGHHVERLDEGQVRLLWEARQAAYDEVLAVLRSRKWAKASRALDDLLAAAPWDLAHDPPIRPLADRALERRWRRVVRHADHLTELSPHERHRVRIEAKKLRYGCEFFESLYAGDAPRVVTETGVVLTGPLAYAWQVEHVQTALGALNDHHTADLRLRSVGSQAPGVDEEALLDTGAAAVRALAAVPPFWH